MGLYEVIQCYCDKIIRRRLAFVCFSFLYPKEHEASVPHGTSIYLNISPCLAAECNNMQQQLHRTPSNCTILHNRRQTRSFPLISMHISYPSPSQNRYSLIPTDPHFLHLPSRMHTHATACNHAASCGSFWQLKDTIRYLLCISRTPSFWIGLFLTVPLFNNSPQALANFRVFRENSVCSEDSVRQA